MAGRERGGAWVGGFFSRGKGREGKGRGLTVGTVRNMTTSCSCDSTGCLTSAFRNLARPLRLFSMNARSFDRWFPLTTPSASLNTK